jgi:hypothetical protein
MPSATTLFASSKKVFAHYLPTFPLSVDNRVSAQDYYNVQYLNPHGENNKFEAQGGYLRQRPLGVAQGTTAGYRLSNMEAEVRMAMARGITGFTFNVMSTNDIAEPSGLLTLMLQAAANVDSRFKIVAMPDMTVFKSNADAVVEIVTAASRSPAAARLADGRLIVSPFDAGLESPTFWQGVLSRLNTAGIKTAFVPTFLGWNIYATSFEPFSYGYADWGTATVSGSSYFLGTPLAIQSNYGKIFMMPAGPQQYRPKDFIYWEAGNSGAFRAAWTSAIQGSAAWVQQVTWNDFSESSEVEPYTDTTLNRRIGTGFYDLAGYYASWFLTGKQPQITHDVLYYFYRREPTTASASAQAQIDTARSSTPADQIEVLSFLTTPGVVKIEINGQTYTQNAPAGLSSYKVASQPGTPIFTLARGGTDVFSFAGDVEIYGESGLPSGVMDLTYWSGSADATGICSL